MHLFHIRAVSLGFLLVTTATTVLQADDLPVLEFSITPSQQQIRFRPYPSADSYKILRADSIDLPFIEDKSGALSGANWTAPLRTDALGFYRLNVVPMANNDLLTSIVLSRIAYGPTPDELERVKAIGPDAFIQEQLAPEAIQEQLDIDKVTSISDWQYIKVTGTGTSSILYIYATGVGEAYLDDMVLVEGSVAEAGPNLIRNGGFESPLATNDWTVSTNLSGSAVATNLKHSGNSSLHVMATSVGSSQASSIWQTIAPALSTSKTYTLSFWFLRAPTNRASLVVRLSNSAEGTGIFASSANAFTHATRLVNNEADVTTLRAWHTLHAVQSKRQLIETLLQFLENHFVTQYTKSRDWFDQWYDDPQRSWEAVNLEFREIQRWRQALLNPQCTFYDLLKISAESPAQIIYLDTVTSAGNGSNVANENYARELLELFTFGVDNGYDQTDIVETSKTWTGWRLGLVDYPNEFNPFAPRLNPTRGPITNNIPGVWAFNYLATSHNNNAKTIFAGKKVPDRFGPPYAGRNYELKLAARSTTNSIQDGYDVVTHLANQPFTQEFISVKLCRLFIHDDFEHGVYDYTDPNLSAEGKLVKACLAAWENSNPKGQIREVLKTIFNSDLFRGTSAAQQKVKTPLEFTVSAIRALRSQNVDGTFTTETDGNFTTPLDRMGAMKLFDRAEPDGYPEAGPPWISGGTLAERLRWVQAYLTSKNQSGRPSDAGNSFSDPVTLLKAKLPSGAWQSPEAVADYFISILYPGEGRANLDLYRKSAINFLNTADNGTAASLLSSLSMTGTPSPYDTRVRGMVAMLMTLQRFQEQ